MLFLYLGNDLTSDTITNGNIEIVPEPENTEVVICTNTNGIVKNTIEYTECHGSSNTMRRSVNLKTGRFIAPRDGHYFITFSGPLTSYAGMYVSKFQS